MSKENATPKSYTNPCQIVSQQDEDEEDPIVAKLSKIGCLEAHYKVIDCYYDAKDWRKCTSEVKEFAECMNKAKRQQDNSGKN